MTPIDAETPSGWYDKRPNFVTKIESKSKGYVMIVNDNGDTKFIDKNDTPPNGWHFATVTKDSLTRRKLRERQRNEKL